ncbi:MAG: twin-arginine translocation pathway signal protein [Deltaproteobacteria bacterium]|nr:twin-arginine translocation pathway signal protein [Deltaproteobacteria bacterium]
MFLAVHLWISSPAHAEEADEFDHKVTHALETLYETTPGAKLLGDKAKGIMVFPKMVKLGVLAGAQVGDGALLQDGKFTGYYRSVGASFGFQMGLQAFDYVLMFMDDKSLDYLNRSRGWELGSGPGVVVLNKGIAGSATTTTLRKGVYAFIFDQQGAMAGIELQGTKISRLKSKPKPWPSRRDDRLDDD